MNRDLLTFIASTAMLAGGIVAATPATASPALAGWVDGVETKIERRIHYPMGMMGSAPDGRVTVAFTRGEDGRPTGVRVARSSGSALLDGAALRTVRGLRGLAPLPTGFGPGTPVHVQLAYGSGDSEFVRAMDKVRVAARANNDRFAAEHAPQLAANDPR